MKTPSEHAVDHANGKTWAEIIQEVRDETALQLGRDVMEMGLLPFLERLVGEANTDRIFEVHAGERALGDVDRPS